MQRSDNARLASVLLLATVLAAPAASAQYALGHSGYLLGVGDEPLENPAASMVFSLWDDPAQADPQHRTWSSGAACTVAVSGGFYAVTLGASGAGGCGNGLDATALPAGSVRWLEVAVGGVALAPRVRVGAVPNASRAASAARADVADSADVASDLACASPPCVASGEIASLAGTKVETGTLPWDALQALAAPTRVTNLEADLLDGHDADDFADNLHGHGFGDITGVLPAEKLPVSAVEAIADQRIAASGSGIDVIAGSTPPVACDDAHSGYVYFSKADRGFFGCDGLGGWLTIARSQLGLPQNPGLSCKDIFNRTTNAANGNYSIDPDGAGPQGTVQVYCDMGGGGWTRVFYNSMSNSTTGLAMTRSGSDCSTNVQKPSPNGWWLGHGNGDNTLSGDGWPAHEWRLDLTAPITVLDAVSVREKGTMQNHSDYDRTGQSGLISSSPFAADGEFASQYYDGSTWRYFILYRANAGSTTAFDLETSSASGNIRAPYVRWAYQWGGPNACDEANSDGFYMREWSVWVK